MHYTDVDGKQILDACSGLWCVNAGHGQDKITKAIQQQAARLDFAPNFQFSHPLSFELSERLAALSPEPLNHLFFTNSGSEAADTTLKIALHYQAAKGHPHKKRLVGREKSYHGVGFGGISVGGLPNNQRHFQLLPHVSHLPHTLNHEHNAFSRGEPDWGIELVEKLNDIHQAHEDIAAVIVEPVVGSAGVIIPPKGYLKRLKEICDDIGALLIFDEVITAFGRIGEPFAAHRFDITPDIISTAKGLTNGCVPMGAVFVKDEIYQTITDSAKDKTIEFFHGYTYTGHPLACAAALATLDVYKEQALFQRSREMESYFEKAVHSLKGIDSIIDIRNFGLMAAIELKPHETTSGLRAYEVLEFCFNHGLLIRITADTIALSPPLIVEKDHIDSIVNILADGIRSAS